MEIDEELAHLLLARVRRGEAAAFDELVHRCDRPVLELAWRLLWDRQDAEDVRQLAWMRVWQGLEGFAERAAFATWLYRIVVNLCRDRLRMRRRVPVMRQAPLEQVLAVDADPSNALGKEELKRRVTAALESLPADERECLVLRHYHDLPVTAIAQVVGRPRTTVASCLDRALERLAHRLRSLAPQSETRSA